MKYSTTALLVLTITLSGCGWVDSSGESTPPIIITGPEPIIDDPTPIPDPEPPIIPPTDTYIPVFPINLIVVENQDTVFDVAYSGFDEFTIDPVDGFTITTTRSEQGSEVTVRPELSVHPIETFTQTFVSTVTSDLDNSLHIQPFDVTVVPTDAPDVYILAGQSNMVGFPEIDVVVEDFFGGLDEPNPRIQQLNVRSNNNLRSWQVFEDFVDIDNNTDIPRIITASDPLHSHIKTESSIGLGMSFAIDALENTSSTIVLVPTAFASSAFCEETGPAGSWNAVETGSNVLGNTWMFDRAVMRANLAINETGGILRGILWHQGESDSGRMACAVRYEENLVTLIREFRSQVIGDNEMVPFIAGTMSRGGDYAEFDRPKSTVDAVHKNLNSIVPDATGTANLDDLIPANGFQCGIRGDCIHFGASALREAGKRYYEELYRVVY